MLIFARQFTVVLPRVIEFPSSSWVEVRYPMPQYGTEAFLEHYDPSHIETDDLLACGTACSTWVGHVVFADLTDPYVVTVVCEPLRRNYPFRWSRRWKLASASHFGELSGGLMWDNDRERWAISRSGGIPYNPQLVGECAVNAYPGGDVAVVDLTDPVFAGRSGHAKSYEAYAALRAPVAS